MGKWQVAARASKSQAFGAEQLKVLFEIGLESDGPYSPLLMGTVSDFVI